MDFSRFSVDAALLEGAAASDTYRAVFYERLLAELFEKKENLFVKTDVEQDRATIVAFPLMHWAFSRRGKGMPASKALYLCAEELAARSAFEASRAMLASVQAGPKLCLLDKSGSVPASEGELGSADCVFATLEAFGDTFREDSLTPREFGFIIADQAELLAEKPGELLRSVQGRLLPSWERRGLVIANKHTPRAKNFAWDFADNPKEIKLAAALGFGGSIASKSLEIKEADKIRFILNLQKNPEEGPLCVFCNLKSTAAELAARLTMNSVPADYIGGNLNPDRKRQIVEKALTSKGAFVLILTDEGAKGAEKPGFPRLVNYDMPLEPELYFDRLAFIDRDNESAMLYNLICDRYVYGVPAIERMIQKSLSAQPLDQSMTLPEDASAGKEIPLPERRFDRRDRRGGRDERSRRPDRADGADRHGDRRGADSGSAEPRDPYAMSMEERLAVYKKRYGKALSSNASGSGPSSRGSARAPSEHPMETPADNPQNPGGILGKLQNLFGTRKE
jgi:superfamily II DNA/RNA helicase